jgi:hypothetical protein
MTLKKEEKKEINIQKAKAWIKENFWKRFFKYKLIELVAIPLTILAGFKVPYWLGQGAKKLFNITYCPDLNDYSRMCFNRWFDTWIIGATILFALGILIFINYQIVRENLKKEAKKKFGVSYYDL